jgi:hypothetical protein
MEKVQQKNFFPDFSRHFFLATSPLSIALFLLSKRMKKQARAV